MFPFEWVEEARQRNEPCSLCVLEVDPAAVLPAVSVQGSWNKCNGIIRGCKEGRTLIEDHVCEGLDPFGRLVNLGKRIFGSSAMRAGVWTAEQHLRVYLQSHPTQQILAWVGNGNLLNNPHFVTFDGASKQRVLYRMASESQHLGRNGRIYSCLVVRKPERGARVSIEDLFFEDDERGPEVYAADGHCITDEVEFATYGQALVKDGRSIEDADLLRMIEVGEFYDLRHVFLFGRVEAGEDRRIDVGLAGLWNEHGHIDTDAVETALRGGRTVADVRQFPPDLVRHAMAAKGYQEVFDPRAPGEYALSDGALSLVLKRGIYPHNMIGIREDGRVIVAAVRGLSNRIGVTLQGGAEIMKSLGAREALLVDNGGDVVLSFDGDVVVRSSEGQHDKLRSIIVFRTVLSPGQMHCFDLRLVRYLKQYASDQTVRR